MTIMLAIPTHVTTNPMRSLTPLSATDAIQYHTVRAHVVHRSICASDVTWVIVDSLTLTDFLHRDPAESSSTRLDRCNEEIDNP
jgi:hypothetical protein